MNINEISKKCTDQKSGSTLMKDLKCYRLKNVKRF